MKRKDFIDGTLLLAFSLILMGLTGNISDSFYFGGIAGKLAMIIILDLGAIFCLIAGGSILLGKGKFWFDD